MIGNDVVDIEAARHESNIWRKGWQEKLFTADERAFIKASQDAEVAVWLMWSMKEAAYKAWNRQTGIRTFPPHNLQCTIDRLTESESSGSVSFACDVFYTKSSILNNCIHTIAAQSKKMFIGIIHLSESDVVKDNFRLPYFEQDRGMRPASKSHHGRYNFSIGLINI
jgi:phosphopantetheinyl transferase (holo-ACP synthase)